MSIYDKKGETIGSTTTVYHVYPTLWLSLDFARFCHRIAKGGVC
jgi:hypothetical protein